MKKKAQTLYFTLTDNKKADKIGIVQKPHLTAYFYDTKPSNIWQAK